MLAEQQCYHGNIRITTWQQCQQQISQTLTFNILKSKVISPEQCDTECLDTPCDIPDCVPKKYIIDSRIHLPKSALAQK